MKILFLSRSTLYTLRGGDTVQVSKTAAALRRLGVKVEIQLAGSIRKKQLQEYDLVHFFNLIRPADMLPYMDIPLPKIISPVYVDYSEYDKKERGGMSGAAANMLSKHQMEYLKALGRHVKGQDKIGALQYLAGHKQAMRKALEKASLILPNSFSEAERIRKDMGASFDFRVVPNGVDGRFFLNINNVVRKPRSVLCVARFEGNKNQHRLIEATRDLDVDLILAGKPSPNHRDYYEKCKKLSHKRVAFAGFVEGQALVDLYWSSSVHALPSWFETTGLCSLEAGAAGCNLVVSDRGDTMEYFSGHAEFCQPDEVSSIRNAIEKALDKPHDDSFRERIKKEFTWEAAAKATLDVYKEILK